MKLPAPARNTAPCFSVRPRRGALLSVLGRLSACLALALTTAGCVDLRADATVAANGSGRLIVEYTVP
ncbi:MAG TPA: hypothetical protein VLH39_01635, partial [Magnetospirillaceae bacterium]|nr:hypothetical protein [Magnetospirillaceae bacterium]